MSGIHEMMSPEVQIDKSTLKPLRRATLYFAILYSMVFFLAVLLPLLLGFGLAALARHFREDHSFGFVGGMAIITGIFASLLQAFAFLSALRDDSSVILAPMAV